MRSQVQAQDKPALNQEPKKPLILAKGIRPFNKTKPLVVITKQVHKRTMSPYKAKVVADENGDVWFFLI